MSDEQMSLFEEWWALDGRNSYAESRIDVLRIWAAGYAYGQKAERERCANLAECQNHRHYHENCMGYQIADAIREGWTA